MSDRSAMAQEVALMLGWQASATCKFGGVYLKSPFAAAMYYTEEELSTLHRVLTEGKRAREALAFYADEKNWQWREPAPGLGMRPRVEHDRGEHARTALSGGTPHGS